MANFMNKMKTPKPIKPIKKVEVKIEEKEVEPIVDAVETAQPDKQATNEVIQEVSDVESTKEEDNKLEDQALEEITQDANNEEIKEEIKETEEAELKPEVEEIQEDEVKEDAKEVKEPVKTKKRSSKKAKQKSESVDTKVQQETLEIKQAEILMQDVIMPSFPEWLEEKERVNGLLGHIVITEELDPTSVKALIANMSSTSREISVLSSEAKSAYNNLKEIIEQVRTENSTGSNSEERKLNGIFALKHYEKDGNMVDLTSLIRIARERNDFYETAMKQIEINRQMLITFSSVYKIELGQAY